MAMADTQGTATKCYITKILWGFSMSKTFGFAENIHGVLFFKEEKDFYATCEVVRCQQ